MTTNAKRTLLAAISALTLCACSVTPEYTELASGAFTQRNYAAADELMEGARISGRNQSVLVGTIVDIDSLDHSSRLGRLVAEQIAARLTQQGFNVVEMRLRNDVRLREGSGELLLSRDSLAVSQKHDASLVVVGSYALASSHVYLTIRAVAPKDNKTISAVNYVLPLTENTRLLATN